MNAPFVFGPRHHRKTWSLVCFLLIVPILMVNEPRHARALEPPLQMSADQTDPRQMKFPPVELNPPEPERIALENGIVVYLLEDHELPLVTVSATIRTGGWMDPSDKVGLAALTGLTMRTGGTQGTAAADGSARVRARIPGSRSFGPDHSGKEKGAAFAAPRFGSAPHSQLVGAGAAGAAGSAGAAGGAGSTHFASLAAAIESPRYASTG